MRNRFFCLLCFAILLTSSTLSFSPSSEKLELTEESLNKFINNIQFIVEDFLQMKFHHLPELKIITKTQFKEIIRAELLITERKELHHFSSREYVHFIDSEASKAAEEIFAKHGLHEKNIFIIKENIDKLATYPQTQPPNNIQLLKLFLIHEMVHAMQDQYVDILSQTKTAKTTTELKYLNILYEGHATLVTELLGRKYFDDKYVDVFFNFLDPGPGKENIYAIGEKFIYENYYKNGGNAATWELLKNPPMKFKLKQTAP